MDTASGVALVLSIGIDILLVLRFGIESGPD